MSSPISPKDIDVSLFKYSEVKTLTSGAKAAYINYGSGKLRIQTPVMFLPYGISEGGFEDKTAKVDKKVEKAENKFDITLSFKGLDENPKIKVFLDKLREVENKIINDAFENRIAWFKNNYEGNKAFVSHLFSPIVKVDKDKITGEVIGKYPPTIRFKLPYDNENTKFNFRAVDMDTNDNIVFDEIYKKLKSGKAQLIVELTSIWFAGGKFGCTWKVNAGKFKCSANNSIEFIQDSDTEKNKDDEEEDDDELNVVTKVQSAVNVNTNISNSDDEFKDTIDDSNDVSESDTVTPPPPPAKGRAKTTKK